MQKIRVEINTKDPGKGTKDTTYTLRVEGSIPLRDTHCFFTLAALLARDIFLPS